MDEPTSALNDVETENLFQFIHKAAAQGVSIFYISHKLDELFEVADRVVDSISEKIDIESIFMQAMLTGK